MKKNILNMLLVLLAATAFSCDYADNTVDRDSDQQVTAEDQKIIAEMTMESLDADNNGDMALIRDSFLLGLGEEVEYGNTLPTAPPADPFHHCGRFHRDGKDMPVDMTYTVEYIDCDGIAQTAYDPATTAQVNITSSIIKSDNDANEDDTKIYTRNDSIVVTGLCGEANETVIINGSGSGSKDFSWQNEDGSVKRHFTMESKYTFTDITIPAAGENHFPVSGTIDYTHTMDKTWTTDKGTVEKKFEVTVTVTFNGTDHPEITINRIKTFTGDMNTGTAEPDCNCD